MNRKVYWNAEWSLIDTKPNVLRGLSLKIIFMLRYDLRSLIKLK
eukprot:UN16042